MRLFLTVTITLLLAAFVLGAAQATQTDWRFQLQAADTSAGNAGPVMQAGVASTASDGVDSNDLQAAYAQNPTTTIWAVCLITGDSNNWTRDIMKGDTTLPKVYDMRVAGLQDTTATTIRLTFSTLSTGVLPPATVNSANVKYTLTMVSNKGISGAPANNTIWTLTMPTTASTAFFTLDLPMLKVTSATMTANGYAFQFRQDAVPEPSGLMTIGVGLMGLAGIIYRKRKA